MTAPIRSGATSSGIAAAALLSFSFVSLAVPAAAAPSLVVDVDTGRVLHAEEASSPWYPASVTKLMTAYVALREVEARRIGMETPLIVSARAAAAAPSKVGFKPGMEVTLENALRIIMVKSANDVSITIAEAVGGSVETFAAMMNREAARLGMRDSNFVNPNGLPDENNRSSARDLAILGRALLLEFPGYEDLWGIGAIKLGKRVMQNTNGLVGRYPGTIGMKTGFICSSGFNVVAAAERNGRRLIAVVLGSHSAAARTIKTAELLDKGFAANPWSAPTLESLPSGFGSPPDLRPDVCGKRRGIPGEDDGEAPVAAGGNSDNPVQSFFQSAAATPGVASVRGEGGRYALAPRARFEPIVVYAGRKPGSTAVARGPVGTDVAAGVPQEAQAFAPAIAGTAKPTPLREGPLLLQNPAKPLEKPAAKPILAATPAAKPLDKPAARPLATATKPVPTAKPQPVAAAKPAAKPTSTAASKPTTPAKPKPKPKPAAKPEARGPDVGQPLSILPARLQPAL